MKPTNKPPVIAPAVVIRAQSEMREHPDARVEIALDLISTLQMCGLAALASRHPALPESQGKFAVALVTDVSNHLRSLGFENVADMALLGLNPAADAGHTTPQAQADDWNRLYRIGTPVLVRKDDGSLMHTWTRSEASVLADHTAVIYLDKISGCYRLDRCMPTAKVAKPCTLTT